MPGEGTEYQKVADDLRGRILSGQLTPGDRLVEGDLVGEYDVSRGTVREALRLLASERLITTARGRSGGTFVAALAPEAISGYLQTTVGVLLQHDQVALSDLVEVRQVLEPFAAGLAASRHASLERLTGLIAGAADADRDLRNWEWHREVLRLSGNPLLPALAGPVYELLSARFNRTHGRPTQWLRIEREHREITELIEAGDAVGAVDAMRRHLEGVHLTYLDLAAEPG